MNLFDESDIGEYLPEDIALTVQESISQGDIRKVVIEKGSSKTTLNDLINRRCVLSRHNLHPAQYLFQIAYENNNSASFKAKARNRKMTEFLNKKATPAKSGSTY